MARSHALGLALVALGGCSDAVDIGYVAGVQGGSGSGGDVGEPVPSCAATKSWEADFTADPTATDGNGDGSMDWQLRSGDPFNLGQVGQGVWRPAPNVELDTLPLEDFDQRMIVSLRMEATNRAARSQFWINFDHTADTYSAMFVEADMADLGSKQTVTVYTKPGDVENEQLQRVRGLDATMLDVTLELDVDSDEVGLWVNGQFEGRESYVIRPLSSGQNHRFASLVAREDLGAFDYVRIDLCDGATGP